jgi:hypothetical protein
VLWFPKEPRLLITSDRALFPIRGDFSGASKMGICVPSELGTKKSVIRFYRFSYEPDAYIPLAGNIHPKCGSPPQASAESVCTRIHHPLRRARCGRSSSQLASALSIG